jgi:hypothetical protein
MAVERELPPANQAQRTEDAKVRAALCLGRVAHADSAFREHLLVSHVMCEAGHDDNVQVQVYEVDA